MKEMIARVGDRINKDGIESVFLTAEELVRCKDCKYLIDHYGFMDDGYCESMREKYLIKFKPDNKNWFCPDGERKEGR